MKTVNVRVPDAVAERLDRLAEKTHRTKSYYVREILESHLHELEEAYLALERRSDSNARFHSSEEVEKLLDL